MKSAINETQRVEIFKTNVCSLGDALQLTSLLTRQFPKCRINFDLDDCDKILRVQGDEFDVTKIINALGKLHFSCVLIE
jgi:hypothetical protein